MKLPTQRFPDKLFGVLTVTKVCLAIVVYRLSSLLISISSSNIYLNNHTHPNNQHIPAVDEPFMTNIHSPPVAVLGRWSSTIQLLTLIQISSGVMLVFLQKFVVQNSGTNSFPSLTRCSVLPATSDFQLSISPDCPDNPRHYWKNYLSIISCSAVSSILLIIWISALQLCGPFETILIGSQHDFTIAALTSHFLIVKVYWGTRLIGSVLFACGIGILLVFGQSPSLFAKPNRNINNSVGIFLLLSCLLLQSKFRAMHQTFEKDLSNSLKLQTNSTIVSVFGLLLLTSIDFLTGADMIPFNCSTIGQVVLISFGISLDSVVDVICESKMERNKVARAGTISILLSALGLSAIGIFSSSRLSLSGVVAFMLILLATLSLTSSEKASGSFVGYSSEGQPLLNFPK